MPDGTAIDASIEVGPSTKRRRGNNKKKKKEEH
jgi:hypothetical protein